MVPATVSLPDGSIERSSPVPFYFQLTRILQDEIVSRRWKVGDRVPSEPALCEHFRVSRSTVRQALQMLEQEGHVSRQKGRGTFIAEARQGSWLLQSSDGFFQEEAERLGRKVSSKLLRVEREPLVGWAARSLELEEGADGVTIERLRNVDDVDVLYVVNHLPGALAETLSALDENGSLYDLLRQRAGLSVAGGHRIVEAVNAGRRVGRLLGVSPSAPLAMIESVSWGADLRPFDCYRAWLRTDRLRIDIAVTG
jgi:GntR family transcriptional regulator